MRRNLVTFVGLVLLLETAPRLVRVLMIDAVGPVLFGALPILWSVVVLCLAGVLHAALVHGAVGDLQGRPASFAACLSSAAARLLPLIGLLIVLAVALAAASALLVIPGVVLGVCWIAAVPALIVERRGVWASLKRSAVLTEGRRWAVLGACAVLLLCAFIGFMGFSLAMAFVSDMSKEAVRFTMKFLLAPTLAAAWTLGSSCAAAAIYHELKVTKEGEGADTLAAAFD